MTEISRIWTDPAALSNPAVGVIGPDDPTAVAGGVDLPISSEYRHRTTGNVYTKFGPAATDWAMLAAAAGYLPLSGGNLSAGANLGVPGNLVIGTDPGGTAKLRVGGAAFVSTDLTVGQRIALTGTIGGFGGSVRYIGVGGSASIIYHNVPTGGSHSFAVNESTVVSLGATANFNVAIAGTSASFTGGITSGGNISATAGSMTIAAAGGFSFSGRSYIASPADGQLMLLNAAGTDFSRLMFGGPTNAYVALRRNGTALEVVLADASAYASFVAGAMTIQGTLSVTSTSQLNGNTTVVGDITAYRSATPTTGVIYLRQDQTRYLYFDGTKYVLNGAGADIGGAVNMGALTATTGTFTQSAQINSTSSTAALGFGNTGAQLQFLNSPNRFYFSNMVQGQSGTLTGRNTAQFYVADASNALIWGHANPDFRCALGAYASVGYPYLMFYAYQGASDTDYRAGPGTRPSRIHAHSDGTIYFSSATTGAADTALTWTLGVSFGPSGGVTAPGSVNAQDITNGFMLNGVISHWRSAGYGIINDSAGVPAIYTGGSTDLANYYRNGNHYFQNKDASATYAEFRSSTDGGATVYTNLAVRGDITAYRLSATTTGVLYLGLNSGQRYLYYDGTKYILNGAAVVANDFVLA